MLTLHDSSGVISGAIHNASQHQWGRKLIVGIYQHSVSSSIAQKHWSQANADPFLPGSTLP